MFKYYHPIEPRFQPNKPELVTLYGDDSLSPEDVLSEHDYNAFMEGDYTFQDLRNYAQRYPELMGFWATLIKGVAKVGKKIGGGIGKAVRRKRKRKKKKRAKAREKKRIQQLVFQREMVKKQKQKKLLTLGAVATAALLLLGS